MPRPVFPSRCSHSSPGFFNHLPMRSTIPVALLCRSRQTGTFTVLVLAVAIANCVFKPSSFLGICELSFTVHVLIADGKLCTTVNTLHCTCPRFHLPPFHVKAHRRHWLGKRSINHPPVLRLVQHVQCRPDYTVRSVFAGSPIMAGGEASCSTCNIHWVVWGGTSQRVKTMYAGHLPANPGWLCRIQLAAGLC